MICVHQQPNVNRKVRRKVLIIPYITSKFLMVKDIKTGEWGFISGGVKKNESYYQAANRELKEETSGVLKSIGSKYQNFMFKTWYRPYEMLAIDKKRKEVIESLYMVYIFKLPRFNKSLLSQFEPNSEVNELCIAEFDSVDNVWDFCVDFYNNRLKKKLPELANNAI
jgi:8-oxo-dGTP pyrophosphatase MutT (NUDIX family)